MDKKNKTSEVLHYLKTHKKGLTQQEAAELFGSYRLSAIIYNLRDRGYNIITIREDVIDRYGHKSRPGRYIMVED